MDFRTLKKLTIGGIELKQLFINGTQVWKSGYKNWVKYSTEADGKTIYNGGLGYKNDYRVRSGGAEVVATSCACTGFMPVKSGDVVRVSGVEFNVVTNGNAINASDSSFNNLGQLVANFPSGGYGIFASGETYFPYSWKSIVEEKTGVWRWVVPPADSGVAYIRLSAQVLDGSSMIVTINEEIT